jgi:galactose mutarotase-like enzyme
MTMFEVGTPDTGASFDVVDGARLVSLRFDGLELLRTTDPRGGFSFGGFVLIPWAGFLPGASLEVGGVTYHFTPNWGDDRVHGLLSESEWAVAGDVLTVAFPEQWPFGGTAQLKPTVEEDEVVVRLDVTAGDCEMPIAIGWHPWFRRRLTSGAEMKLTLPGDARMWEPSSEEEPNGRWIAPGQGPFDNCFSTQGAVVCEWVGDTTAVRLLVSSDSGLIGLYDPEESGIAIEPMTAVPGTLPGWLEPAETQSLTVRMKWEHPEERSRC